MKSHNRGWLDLPLLSASRLREQPQLQWQEAYSLQGTGTTKIRANRIEGIFERFVPVPDAVSELNELGGRGTDELRQRWTELFGMAPSPRISRELLVRAVAHRMQEETHGGLGKSGRRQLARLGRTLGESGSLEVSQTRSFKPGTRLIREWKGKVHEVVIAGGTYIWAGQHYRSLTQIARAITGTRWSGPRFFGLEAGQGAADDRN